jgi:hypothetical protein
VGYHGDDGDDHKLIKCSTLDKREEKGNGIKAEGKSRGFHFSDRSLIECMVRFRIDSHNIKRRTLMLLRLSSATR